MKKGAVFLTYSVVRFCKDCNIQYLFANIQYKVITEFVHENTCFKYLLSMHIV